MSDAAEGSVDQRITELTEKHSSLYDLGHYRSAQRVSREMRQLAKAEHRVITYLHANHQLMNAAQSMLEPEAGIEIAIDSIALLESEEKARLLQPDLPEGHYQYVVHRMSSCAYDNLAKHIAMRDGYNSDGVHDCITDGIQVCRRTGKLECINCFREYATDVYKASDDLDMALHHARAVEQASPRSDTDDRRWVGARDQFHLHLLQGQLDAAIDAGKRAWLLHTGFHARREAQLDTLVLLEIAFWLTGQQDEFARFVANAGVSPVIGDEVPAGEFPRWDVLIGERNAVRLACQGKHAEAIEVLTRFDQLLQSRRCLDLWFENRLRLVACCLMAGEQEKAERLANQLEARAKEARDWLTLRRLKLMMSGEVPVSPIPTVGPFQRGPFAPSTAKHTCCDHDHDHDHSHEHDHRHDHDHDHSHDLANDGTQQAAAATESSAVSPFLTWLDNWFRRMAAATNDEDRATITREILALTVEHMKDAEEAARVIHTAHIFTSHVGAERDAWEWSQQFVDAYPNDPTVINVAASLGMTVREIIKEKDPTADLDAVITFKRLEEMFRKSLDLDSERANNFVRAGQFYLTSDRPGDAERCFARGFRLDRSNSLAALKLADIYSESDRSQDALNVLDLSIREGNEDAQVYWQAGMLAIGQSQYQVAASYLLRYERLTKAEPWVHYYLALCYLETGRPVDALRALETEAQRSPQSQFATSSLRACAAAVGNNLEELRQQLEVVLAIPLSSIDYLTTNGISRLFDRMFEAVLKLPTNDPLRLKLEAVGLAAGFATEAYFDEVRQAGTAQEDVSFYIVVLEQHLDAGWSKSAGCLSGQEAWKSYAAHWGVVALDVTQAEQIAREWQQRCESTPCDLISIDLQSDGYHDKVGALWQGLHVPVESLAASAE